MAGQGPSRRELLQALTLASAAAAFTGFGRWGYAFAENAAHHHDTPKSDPGPHTNYNPQFFTPSEYHSVDVLCALILPATTSLAHPEDGTKTYKTQPGAREAGVAEFIDFMVFSDPTLQETFRNGLQWMDRASAPASTFADLAAPQQDALLQRLAFAAKHRAEEKVGQEFFKLMRRYTVMGFYTTRIGLESLDYPGLTFYASSPGCTHHGNPEHVGI
jgi:hypothetical protein